MLGHLTKAATVLGSLIAVGQAGVQGIRSWSDYKIAEVKSRHEVEIQDIKDRASLANDYLDRLLKKDVSSQDKMMLLGALSTISQHPLQQWAAARKAQLEAEYEDQFKARTTRIEQLLVTVAQDPDEAVLSAKIEAAREQLKASRDDPGESRKIEGEVVDLARQLAELKGRAGLKLTVAQTAITVDNPEDLPKVSNTLQATSKLTLQVMLDAVPDAPPDNVRRYGPFLISAIREYQIVDPKLIAYVIATVGVETGSFEPRTEVGSDAVFGRYETVPGLGNTQPGDGSKFRGRGFLQIAGRALYTSMSARLGLGDLLVQSPDLANDPGIASRVLCAFLIDRAARIRAALDRDDLGAARAVVAGGKVNVERFAKIYRRVIELL